MKIRPQRNEELSEGLLEAARMVQNKSGEGEASPIPEQDSPEYLAALELEAEANANLVPDDTPDVTDAEFTELKEANALNAEFEAPAEESKQDKFRRLWFGKGEPLPEAKQVGIFELAGQDLKHLGNKLRELWIAAGDKVLTAYNTMTLWAKAELETLQKAQADFVRNAEQAAMIRKQERIALSPVAKIEFNEMMEYMNGIWETKVEQDKQHDKLVNKRLDAIETSMKKMTRAYNRAAPIKQEALDELLTAVATGKYVSAIKGYSEIVGCSIEDAKGKLERLVMA